jgi:hypothetical protein
MNRELSGKMALAKQAKNSVLDTAARFQKLDGVEGADVTPPEDKIVMVPRHTQADLPNSDLGDLAKKIPGDFIPEGPKVKANGFSKAGEEGLETADIHTTSEDKSSDLKFQKLPDGTEVYHGTTAEGYAVVRENRQNGTLFMATSDQPMTDVYQQASVPNFEGPAPINDPEKNKPGTFGSALKDLADAPQTSGNGTYMQGVRQRTEMVKNVLGSFGSLFGKGKE